MKDGKKNGILDIDDAAVVEKDSEGKVHVKNQISHGTSALFILTSKENPTAELAIQRNYKGKVLQTTLDSEMEESLKKSLGDDSPLN